LKKKKTSKENKEIEGSPAGKAHITELSSQPRAAPVSSAQVPSQDAVAAAQSNSPLLLPLAAPHLAGAASSLCPATTSLRQERKKRNKEKNEKDAARDAN
jgi:hypothetical protein